MNRLTHPAVQGIIDNAKNASTLLDENGLHTQEHPHTVSPPGIPEEPSRSTVTTTIARDTAGITRAVTLLSLASTNLTFFKQNALLSSADLKIAETAVNQSKKFLQQNKRELFVNTRQNLKLLDGRHKAMQQELRSLKASLRKTEDIEKQRLIAGKINLLNLSRRGLQRLITDNSHILDFLESSQVPDAPVKRMKAGKKRGSNG